MPKSWIDVKFTALKRILKLKLTTFPSEKVANIIAHADRKTVETLHADNEYYNAQKEYDEADDANYIPSDDNGDSDAIELKD